MNVQILLFGIAKDILKTASLDVSFYENTTVAVLKNQLVSMYPELKNISTYAIAINESYADDEDIVNENDVIALIPPVSGG